MENDILHQTKQIKVNALAFLNAMEKMAGEFDLPNVPTSFGYIKQKLQEDEYTVLVVGEAKRGKSSFINALIGKEVLPTDTKVATSQAFRIQNSERESYRLRFTDDTIQEIFLEDLKKFGSQANIDKDGSALEIHGKAIQWIEVNIPVKLLPKNMVLIDTPGVGSLYHHHAEVTNRFVPYADAVIFVLDSKVPILDIEHRFIQRIVKQTQDIFFIQTKIDIIEDWKKLLERNKEILSKEYGSQLKKIEIWPVSNKTLMKASEQEKYADIFLQTSHFEELRRNLELFLFKIAGINRVAAGLSESGQYYVSGLNVLKRRQQVLRSNSTSEKNNLLEELQSKNKELEKAWNKNGFERKEHLKNFNDEVDLAQKQFKQAFTTSGIIYKSISKEVNDAKKNKELDKCLKNLHNKIEELFLDDFNNIVIYLKNKFQEHLIKVHNDPHFDYDIPEGEHYKEILATVNQILEVKRESLMKGGKIWVSIKKLIGNTLNAFLSPIISLRKFIDDLFVKPNTSLEQKKSTIISTTKQLLQEMLQEIEQINIHVGKKTSLIQDFFSGYKRIFEEQIDIKYNDKTKANEQEIKKLEELLQQKESLQEEEIAKLEGNLKGWERQKEMMNKLALSLKQMEDQYKSPQLASF